MTIHDVLTQQLQTTQGQINAYEQDITNLLCLLGNLQQQQGVIVTWLAANPAP